MITYKLNGNTEEKTYNICKECHQQLKIAKKNDKKSKK